MITNLHIENFKSFESVDLPLGPVTLLVGTNASGKSNLGDALRFVHGIGLGYTVAEILGEKYGPGGILWRGIRGGARETPRQGSSSFTLSVDVQPEYKLYHLPENGPAVVHYSLTVDVSDNLLGPRVVRESLSVPNGWYWFNSHPGKTDPLAQQEKHEVRIRLRKYGDNKRWGRTLSFTSARPILSQIGEADVLPWDRKVADAILGELKAMRFLDLDPAAMRVPSQPGQVILGDRGENLSSVLQAIVQNPVKRDVLTEWLRALTPLDVEGFEFVPDHAGRILAYLKEPNDQTISVLSASDGTLRFLAMVAALLSPDTGKTFFFEELDNGIHPTRLHLLLDLVEQACKGQRLQVIGTTHNPALLTFLSDDTRRDAHLVYRPEGSTASRSRRIVDLPDVERVLETQDLGKLHATGWLEDAAAFADARAEEPGA